MDINQAIGRIKSRAQDLFTLGPRDIIGIDIGLSAVKMAELKKSSGGFKLHNYVSMPLPEATVIEDEIEKEEELGQAIKDAYEGLDTNRKMACLGLGGPGTVARKLQLSGGSDQDIEDQVSWEAEQYLPFPIEDAALSFHVFGENEGGGVDVLVAAAKNEVVQSFKAIVEKAGPRVKLIDLTVVAVVNVFELVFKDKLENSIESWIVLDLGAQRTHFTIYKKKSIIFTKEMNIGGSMVTEEIQRQMGVTYKEAEDLKTRGDDKGNLPVEIVEIIKEIKGDFFRELKKTVDFYITSTQDDNFKECVVTGGGLMLPGMMEELESNLGIPATILNPFETIECDRNKFTEEEINKMAFTGVAAIGLAMREF